MPSAFNLCAEDVKTTDEHDAYVIAHAVSWSAFVLANRQRHKKVAPTREQARSEAQKMANEHRRPVLVYAISVHGRQAVAETVQPA